MRFPVTRLLGTLKMFQFDSCWCWTLAWQQGQGHFHLSSSSCLGSCETQKRWELSCCIKKTYVCVCVWERERMACIYTCATSCFFFFWFPNFFCLQIAATWFQSAQLIVLSCIDIMALWLYLSYWTLFFCFVWTPTSWFIIFVFHYVL